MHSLGIWTVTYRKVVELFNFYKNTKICDSTTSITLAYILQCLQHQLQKHRGQQEKQIFKIMDGL